MLIDPKTRQYFQIRRLGEFNSQTTDAFAAMLRDSILDDGMVALLGPYGTGKTTILRRVKRELSDNKQHVVRFIAVGDLQDKPLRMGTIISALLLSLCEGTGEAPMRASEARSRQLERLLGLARVQNNQRICLVIEDAHRLHPSTLSALKLLREADFLGRAPLLSIVLVGWPDLETKLQARRDILTRLSCINLIEDEGWMTYAERLAYLDAVYNGIIEQATRERIAAMHRVPVEMDYAVAKGLREARLGGYDVLDHRSYSLTSTELWDELKARGHSLADIGGAAGGLSTSSVSDAVRGRGPHQDAVRSGMEALLARDAERPALQRVGV